LTCVYLTKQVNKVFNLIVDLCDYSKEALLTEKVHSNIFLVFPAGMLRVGWTGGDWTQGHP